MDKILRRFDSRFAIGSSEGPRSHLWHVWRTKNEVYAASSDMAGVEKWSFHSGGNCRKAFVSEKPKPAGLEDRAFHKCRRPPPPVKGAHGGTCVLEVAIPSNYLSTQLKAPTTEPDFWIPAAPHGKTTALEMFFTLEEESVVRSLMEPNKRFVRVYTQLPNGEAFVVSSHETEFNGENFFIPASGKHLKDFVIYEEDPDQTGRPIRVTFCSNPKDDDRVYVWEYGAYEADARTIAGLDGAATFTRSKIFVATDWKV